MARGRYPLEGKSVLVTGPARGIGAEAVRQLAGRGASVALVGLEPREMERVASSCAGSGETLCFEADVRDQEALDRAVAETVSRFGGLDVVIANAGIAPIGTLRTIDPVAFERVVDVNLFGAWRTIRAALPHVTERRGYVLVVASLAAVLRAPGFGAYAAAKAGVEALADALRIEVHHDGVDVGVAYFSWIDSEMVTAAYENPAYARLRASLKGPIGKTYPVGNAAAAMVRGIESRSRWICAPGWLRAVLALRGVIWKVAERDAHEHAPEVVALAERQVEERGAAEASRPVGSGGEAAEAAEG